MKTKIVCVDFYRVHTMIKDMLRYDSAFACDKFPGIVAYPRFQSRNGTWGGKPTVDRWRSFLAGFNPMPLTPTELKDIGIVATVESMFADGWYTIEFRSSSEQVYLRNYRD